MDEILDFLKENKTYFLATMNGDKPAIRPFGTIMKFEGKLYIQTGRSKDVYKQMVACPQVALCACSHEGGWVRINATAVEDARIEANEALLADYPELGHRYKADDGECVVFYLKDGTAIFNSFTAGPRTVTF